MYAILFQTQHIMVVSFQQGSALTCSSHNIISMCIILLIKCVALINFRISSARELHSENV